MIQARKLIKKCSLQLQMACSFHENNFYMYPMCFKRGWPITLVVAKKSKKKNQNKNRTLEKKKIKNSASRTQFKTPVALIDMSV